MERYDRQWQSQAFRAGAPAWLRPWLTDSGSLTARLAARCAKLQVRVLRQAMALPNEDERRLIGLPRGRRAWLREVLLVADGRAVVFAHSVIAPRDLRGPWRMAAAVGGRPLGAALFADPRIARGPLHGERLEAEHPLRRRAQRAVGGTLPTLWARRSRFLRRGRPLLVTEVFLPAIEDLRRR